MAGDAVAEEAARGRCGVPQMGPDGHLSVVEGGWFHLTPICRTPRQVRQLGLRGRLVWCHTFFFLFSSHYWTLLSSPTGPHPPLRVVRRPNRGRIGGGGWTPSCGTYLWFFRIASGFSTPTLVNSDVEAPINACTNNEIRRDRFQIDPGTNTSSISKIQFAGARTHDVCTYCR